MPVKQQADLCAYSLLALANINENDNWQSATNEFMRIHDVLQFTGSSYGVVYAENSRETFRKQAMHPFRIAAIIEDNGKATNSPLYRYRITNETLELIQSFDSPNWNEKLSGFQSHHKTLKELYTNRRKLEQIPITVNSEVFTLSTGSHNELQKAILDEFASRFAQGSIVLYIGDTRHKNLFKDTEYLSRLSVLLTDHDKLPDVIIYDPKKDWIYFIEAVTSVGPISCKRLMEIAEITKECKSEKIYVTAFPDIQTYKKFATELAWETEVWISEVPDHMIHLNGDKFLGPRK